MLDGQGCPLYGLNKSADQNKRRYVAANLATSDRKYENSHQHQNSIYPQPLNNSFTNLNNLNILSSSYLNKIPLSPPQHLNCNSLSPASLPNSSPNTWQDASMFPNTSADKATLPSTCWRCFPADASILIRRGQWASVRTLPPCNLPLTFLHCQYSLQNDFLEAEFSDTHNNPNETIGNGNYPGTGSNSINGYHDNRNIGCLGNLLPEGVNRTHAMSGDVLTVRVLPDTLFLVRDKGWCSFLPSVAARRYGVQGFMFLSPGDVCLSVCNQQEIPLSPLDTTSPSYLFNTTSPLDTTSPSYLFNTTSPLDTISPSYLFNTASPLNSAGQTQSMSCRAKRPMNSFMLFAKKFRLELTRLHPGKDNRDISILLGERWRALTPEEKRMYAEEAQNLAEIQKQTYPDCWKRRRSK